MLNAIGIKEQARFCRSKERLHTSEGYENVISFEH